MVGEKWRQMSEEERERISSQCAADGGREHEEYEGGTDAERLSQDGVHAWDASLSNILVKWA